MADKEKAIVLRTYSNTWRFARQIYAIDRFRLPVPINPSDLGYFAAGLLITFGLLRLLPFLNAVPAVIRYILIPFALMKFLTKKKFDGKLPHKFMMGYLSYLMLPKVIVRFQAGERYRSGRVTPVAFRMNDMVNVTELVRKRRKGSNV